MNGFELNKEGYYPLYVKEVNNEYYVYNTITNAIFLMDSKAKEVLLEGADIDLPEYSEEKEFFLNNFILVTQENTEMLTKLYSQTVENSKKNGISSITLMISQECNLRCKYCYGEGGEYSHKGKMSIEVAKKAVDFFISQANGDKLNICFFGGEPLMNFDVVREIVSYTKALEKSTGKKFTYCMTTNATLIDEEIQRFLRENKISLTVSMDGTKETNDANRFFLNRKGAYDIINKKALKLKNQVTVRATIAPPNLNIKENLLHIINELGYRQVAWAEADNLFTEEAYEELFKNMVDFLDEMKKLIKENKYEEIKRFHSFTNMLKKFNHDGLRCKGCGAGTNMVAIDIDGKVYPCHRFVGIDAASLGNVTNGINEDHTFYCQAFLGEFEKCRLCMARSICGGGCINENYFENQFVNKPSEKHCEYKKKLVDMMLEIYIELSEAERKTILG